MIAPHKLDGARTAGRGTSHRPSQARQQLRFGGWAWSPPVWRCITAYAITQEEHVGHRSIDVLFRRADHLSHCHQCCLEVFGFVVVVVVVEEHRQATTRAARAPCRWAGEGAAPPRAWSTSSRRASTALSTHRESAREWRECLRESKAAKERMGGYRAVGEIRNNVDGHPGRHHPVATWKMAN